MAKIPPPPPIANADPTFNRWLLELTAILSASGGGVDPASVPGYAALQSQVATNTADIVILEGTTGSQGGAIAFLSAQITTLQNDVAVINGQLTTLGARGELLFGAGAPAAGLGKVNDWYGDTAGVAGARVWVKKAAGVWTAFPF